jgi:hypothetical protein
VLRARGLQAGRTKLLGQPPLVEQGRCFSKVTDNQATELYFEEVFEQGFAGGDPLFDLRNYFYPESDDPNIDRLSNAGSVAEVLEMVEEVGPLPAT